MKRVRILWTGFSLQLTKYPWSKLHLGFLECKPNLEWTHELDGMTCISACPRLEYRNRSNTKEEPACWKTGPKGIPCLRTLRRCVRWVLDHTLSSHSAQGQTSLVRFERRAEGLENGWQLRGAKRWGERSWRSNSTMRLLLELTMCFVYKPIASYTTALLSSFCAWFIQKDWTEGERVSGQTKPTGFKLLSHVDTANAFENLGRSIRLNFWTYRNPSSLILNAPQQSRWNFLVISLSVKCLRGDNCRAYQIDSWNSRRTCVELTRWW